MIGKSINIKSLLFDNKGLKQTIFKNTFWLALAEAITNFSKLFLIVYVARIFGATEYGKFTFALSFVSLFAIFSDFGLGSLTIREFSKEKKDTKEFSSILSLKLVLSLIALIVILFSSFFVTKDVEIQKVIWILAVYILSNSFLGITYAFFRARQQMEYEAFVKILQAVAVTGIGFFIIFKIPSVENLSFGYLFASLIALIFTIFLFYSKIYPLKLNFDKATWRKFLTMSWPLGLSAILSMVYVNIDSIMMGNFNQITQVGWYNAAYKIVGITLIPANFISGSFFPYLSKSFEQSKEKFKKAFDYYLEIIIFLSVPIVIGGIVLAPKIIDLVYDPSYFPSIFAFKLLIAITFLSFLSGPFNQTLFILNKQKKLLLIIFLSATTNVILNLILIPKYSLYGAAIARVSTFLLILILTIWFALKISSVKLISSKMWFNFIGALASSSLMYFVISFPNIYKLHVAFSILIGAGVYLICFFVYKRLADRVLTY
ncbi:MAG: flippase [Candidatus Nealsonbacteria bacterium]|nr:MAG: flippase [Candidatus Nealsonbacteria bacterium]